MRVRHDHGIKHLSKLPFFAFVSAHLCMLPAVFSLHMYPAICPCKHICLYKRVYILAFTACTQLLPSYRICTSVCIWPCEQLCTSLCLPVHIRLTLKLVNAPLHTCLRLFTCFYLPLFVRMPVNIGLATVYARRPLKLHGP